MSRKRRSSRFAWLPRDLQLTTVVAGATVLLAFALGGASQSNLLRLTLLELGSLPLLGLAASEAMKSDNLRTHAFALGLAAAAVLIPLAQLAPLPLTVWSSLPGREEIAPVFAAAGIAPGLISFSLSPDDTWNAVLALVSPIAVFLIVLLRAKELPRLLVWTVLAASAVSIALGIAQFVVGGRALFPWPNTDTGSVPGLFANRNHLATLCLATIPYAAALFVTVPRHKAAWRWLTAVYALVAILMLALIRSRTGIVLLLPVGLASAVAAWVAAGRPTPSRQTLLVGGGLGVLLLAVGVSAVSFNIDRFNADDIEGGNRLRSWPLVAETAQAHLPLGTGVGTFDQVYRSVEPLAEVDPTFFNHAHNDYLELWLETGWLGVAALIAFALWYGRRSFVVWFSSRRSLALGRAASISILAILSHSFVDYPLRTTTMTVLLAVCAAILELQGRTAHATGVR